MTSASSQTVWLMTSIDNQIVPPFIDTIASFDFDQGIEKIAESTDDFYAKHTAATNKRTDRKRKAPKFDWKAIAAELENSDTWIESGNEGLHIFVKSMILGTELNFEDGEKIKKEELNARRLSR